MPGPKILHDPYVEAVEKVRHMQQRGSLSTHRGAVRLGPTGFVPRPLRRSPAPPQKREDHTYAEAVQLIEEMRGRVVEVIRVKGRVVLNCVCHEDNVPYTLSVKA